MTQHPAIRIERRENATLVTLDDGKANALSSPVMNALRHTLVELAPGMTRAIALEGDRQLETGTADVQLR